MKYMNSIYLKPKDLMVLERITYIGAIKKIQKIKENIEEYGLNGKSYNSFGPKYHISHEVYASYYGIELNHLKDALSEERLLLIKPTDLIHLEGANNIKTASYRYANYLFNSDKSFVNARLSINEYAELNNTTVGQIILLFIEKEANELIYQQLLEL